MKNFIYLLYRCKLKIQILGAYKTMYKSFYKFKNIVFICLFSSVKMDSIYTMYKIWNLMKRSEYIYFIIYIRKHWICYCQEIFYQTII